jgi:hypothetical protein
MSQQVNRAPAQLPSAFNDELFENRLIKKVGLPSYLIQQDMAFIQNFKFVTTKIV